MLFKSLLFFRLNYTTQSWKKKKPNYNITKTYLSQNTTKDSQQLRYNNGFQLKMTFNRDFIPSFSTFQKRIAKRKKLLQKGIKFYTTPAPYQRWKKFHVEEFFRSFWRHFENIKVTGSNLPFELISRRYCSFTGQYDINATGLQN